MLNPLIKNEKQTIIMRFNWTSLMLSTRESKPCQSSLDFVMQKIHQFPPSKNMRSLASSVARRRADSLPSDHLDRFIPSRRLNETADLVYAMPPKLGDSSPRSALLLDAFYGMSPQDYKRHRVLNFSLGSSVLEKKTKVELGLTRRISRPAKDFSVPCAFVSGKILDAPDVLADFYAQTVCWASDEKTVFALDNMIYHTGRSLGSAIPIPDQYVYSVTVMSDLQVVSGWNDGYVRVHTLEERDDIPFSYTSRVGSTPIYSMAVTGHNTVVCGDKGGQLHWVDKRMSSRLRRQVVGSQKAITGLAYDGSFSVASGADDHRVKLWDIRKFGPDSVAFHTAHNACIKAIAFQPGSGRYLVSGGGGTCSKLCVYDTINRCVVDTMDTGSQITGLHWFTSDPRYLVTSHGFSDCAVKLWSLDLEKITLENNHPLNTGREGDRVLCIAGSKESNQLVAVTQSEQARFFSVSGVAVSRLSKEDIPKSLSMLSSCPMEIR